MQNAIVAAGHALVADVAASWRNAALNLAGYLLWSRPRVASSRGPTTATTRRIGFDLPLGGAAVILLALILACAS